MPQRARPILAARLGSERALERRLLQKQAAAEHIAASEVQAVEVRVGAVETGLPPDLADQLENIRNRLDTLEP